MHIRVGSGFDVHKLVEGRKLIVGGIEIPFPKGLLGHSDADVLLHAITDAILGALALGDIGSWFPDTNPANKDIDSALLLLKVYAHVKSLGWTVYNIDSTIIAQAPKFRPFIDQIRSRIADILEIEVSQVGLKATTTEGLGFTGRGEGLAAQSTVLLVKNSL